MHSWSVPDLACGTQSAHASQCAAHAGTALQLLGTCTATSCSLTTDGKARSHYSTHLCCCYMCLLACCHPSPHSVTQSLARPLTTHSFTHSLTHSLVHSLICSLSHSHTLTCSLSHSFLYAAFDVAGLAQGEHQCRHSHEWKRTAVRHDLGTPVPRSSPQHNHEYIHSRLYSQLNLSTRCARPSVRLTAAPRVPFCSLLPE